jgi:hypothetical protein
MTPQQEANVAKWVAALESGEFKQGREVLEDAAGNCCCLGVACRLYQREAAVPLVTRIVDEEVTTDHPLGGYPDGVDDEDVDFDPDDFSPTVKAVEYAWGRVAKHRTATLLPDPVMAWLGLRDACGAYGDAPGESSRSPSLSQHNDKGKTFPEIAAIIRSRPRGLFEEAATADAVRPA